MRSKCGEEECRKCEGEELRITVDQCKCDVSCVSWIYYFGPHSFIVFTTTKLK